MKKKRYIIPSTESHRFSMENLMITASPGISNDEFDPVHDEVGAKENPSFNSTEYPHYSPWED
ncbi:hypothetical protein J4864_04175 [Prevotella multiformis]|uniref:hypothetical protein n=1 Tax=Prevotella multiformis TaxID=282402 RepID=UPI001BACE332|nr:hypothetical protein [Prevotella multiformis]QUB70256.1 hypothetical protein J4864_04175 [Prevotella multiformis]